MSLGKLYPLKGGMSTKIFGYRVAFPVDEPLILFSVFNNFLLRSLKNYTICSYCFIQVVIILITRCNRVLGYLTC